MSVIRDPKQDEAIRTGTCYLGDEKVYFKEADKAEAPGHIYSQAGLQEYKNSGACEYHFDEAFAEPEEDESPSWEGPVDYDEVAESHHDRHRLDEVAPWEDATWD